jgi:hypothetical protein
MPTEKKNGPRRAGLLRRIPRRAAPLRATLFREDSSCHHQPPLPSPRIRRLAAPRRHLLTRLAQESPPRGGRSPPFIVPDRDRLHRGPRSAPGGAGPRGVSGEEEDTPRRRRRPDQERLWRPVRLHRRRLRPAPGDDESRFRRRGSPVGVCQRPLAFPVARRPDNESGKEAGSAPG